MATMLMVGAGTGGSVYVFENQEELARQLKGDAERVVGDVSESLGVPPLRFVGAYGVSASGFLLSLNLTFEIRDGIQLNVSALELVLGTGETAERIGVTVPGAVVRFAALRDGNGSVANGSLDGRDLFVLGLPLPELGLEMGPRDVLTASVELQGYTPIRLRVGMPSFFTKDAPILDVEVE